MLDLTFHFETHIDVLPLHLRLLLGNKYQVYVRLHCSHEMYDYITSLGDIKYQYAEREEKVC
jgi:hypothetical protein